MIASIKYKPRKQNTASKTIHRLLTNKKQLQNNQPLFDLTTL